MSLREAAQQALDTLEDPWNVCPEGVADAITALRTALAEPRKHISYVCPQCHWTLDTNPVDDTALLRQALESLEYEAHRGNDDAYRSLRDALRERLGEKT
jgi:hypothetical protein